MKLKITLSAILFFMLLLGNLSANAQTWEKLASLPEGGSIKDLTSDSNSVYALSNTGSEIYYTVDNGLNWQLLPGTFAFWNITNIEADKATGTLYVGTLSRGIRWTSDKGASWQYQLFYVMPESGDGAIIENIARKANVIVVSEPLGTQTRFYMSTNTGATWTSVNTVFANTTALEFIDDGSLLAGTENGISVSGDNGLTWTPLNNGLAGKQVTSIAEKTASSTLFATATFNNITGNTAGCGVYKSSDGGASWSLSSNGMTDAKVSCITIDEVNGAIYATAFSGIYKSFDDGENWILMGNGISGSGFISAASNANGVFCASTISGISYLGTSAANWQPRNNGILVNSINTLCVSAEDDVYTFDNGVSGVYALEDAGWMHAAGNGLPEAFGRDFTSDSNGVLYASYLMPHNGLFRSNDEGATWTSIATMVLPSDIYYVDFSKIIVDGNNNLYAKADYSSDAFTPSQIFKSSDHGATWTVLYTIDTSAFGSITDIDLSNDGKIYISVTDFAFQTKIYFRTTMV